MSGFELIVAKIIKERPKSVWTPCVHSIAALGKDSTLGWCPYCTAREIEAEIEKEAESAEDKEAT